MSHAPSALQGADVPDAAARRSVPRLGNVAPSAASLIAAAMLAAAAWRIWLSLDRILELDELYTMTLVGDPSLPHMWETAFRGVDGNPPLYLTLAWFLVRAVPVGAEPVLRLLNLALMAGAAVTFHGVLRRIADPASAALGLAAFCFVSIGPAYALPELRTYALYLLLAAALVRATLGLIDRPSGRRAAVLATLGGLLALAHSYGGFYVAAAIGSAATMAIVERRYDRMRALAAAAVLPAAITVVWIVVATPHQLATASPYGWILAPDWAVLLLTLTGSVQVSMVALALLPVAAVWAAMHPRRFRAAISADPIRSTLFAILFAFALLTLAAWVASQVVTPFFTFRYFMPNLMIGSTGVTLALSRLRQVTRPPLQAVAALAFVAAGASAIVTGGIDNREVTPCLDPDGHFLEDGFAAAGLPIVTESPHAWMPRNAYAPDRATLYPLDWAVVLGYRRRAPNNAMDYHIMDTLRDEAPAGSALAREVLPTEAILARHDTFLVLNEANRSWFDHLRATVPLQAELLKEGLACKLWRVRLTRASGP